MKREDKIKNLTNLIISTVIVVLSFLPMVYIADEKGSNIFQLVSNFENPTVIYKIIAVILIVIPCLYIFVILFCLLKKDILLFVSFVTYLCNLGFCVVFGLTVFNMTVDKFPVTIWFIIRWVLTIMEYINEKSGDDFWSTLLNIK